MRSCIYISQVAGILLLSIVISNKNIHPNKIQEMMSLPCVARLGATYCYKILLFIIIFLSFASFHSSRTCWSYVKLQVADDFDYSEEFLGVIDMVFLFAYSFGLFFSGNLGDKFHRGRLYAMGMLINFFCFLTITVLGWKGDAHQAVFIIIFAISGLAQSTGFPNSVAMIKDWYILKNILVCIFVLSTNTGNVVGEQFGAVFGTESKTLWPNAIFADCILLLICNILVATLVIPSPQLLEIQPEPKKPELESANTNSVSLASKDPQPKKETLHAITFIEAFKLRGLLSYCGANACMRSVVFGMMYWLPDYLKTVADIEHHRSNYLLAWEFGIMAGTIFGGILTTRYKKFFFIMTTGLVFAIVMFVLVYVFQNQAASAGYPALLFFAAFFLGIPSSLIGTVACISLAEEAENSLNLEAAGTVTGIVDGAGALSGAIFQIIIPLIKTKLFLVEAGLFAIAIMFLIPALKKEFIKKQDPSQKFGLPKTFEMAVEELDEH